MLVFEIFFFLLLLLRLRRCVWRRWPSKVSEASFCFRNGERERKKERNRRREKKGVSGDGGCAFNEVRGGEREIEDAKERVLAFRKEVDAPIAFDEGLVVCLLG